MEEATGKHNREHLIKQFGPQLLFANLFGTNEIRKKSQESFKMFQHLHETYKNSSSGKFVDDAEYNDTKPSRQLFLDRCPTMTAEQKYMSCTGKMRCAIQHWRHFESGGTLRAMLWLQQSFLLNGENRYQYAAEDAIVEVLTQALQTDLIPKLNSLCNGQSVSELQIKIVKIGLNLMQFILNQLKHIDHKMPLALHQKSIQLLNESIEMLEILVNDESQYDKLCSEMELVKMDEWQFYLPQCDKIWIKVGSLGKNTIIYRTWNCFLSPKELLSLYYYMKALTLVDYHLMNRGDVSVFYKTNKEFITTIKKSIEWDESNYRPWYFLGIYYGELENFEKSYECFTKCINYASDDWQKYYECAVEQGYSFCHCLNLLQNENKRDEMIAKFFTDKNFSLPKDKYLKMGNGIHMKHIILRLEHFVDLYNKTKEKAAKIWHIEDPRSDRDNGMELVKSTLASMKGNLKQLKKLKLAEKTQQVCNNCMKSGKDVKLKACSACHQVYYCGRDCQVKDWTNHKNHCKDLSEGRKMTFFIFDEKSRYQKIVLDEKHPLFQKIQLNSKNSNNSSASNSKQATATNHLEAEKYKEMGNKLLKEHKYDEAIDKYRAAIANNPTNCIYFTNLAVAYIQKKELVLAIEGCSKAIELNPTYAKAFRWRAEAKANLGKVGEALVDIQKAIELEPTNDEYKKLQQKYSTL